MAGVEPDTKPLSGKEMLREIRGQFDLSREQVALAANISAKTLESWEDGIRHPTRESLIALIRFYVDYETVQIRCNESSSRFVTRKKINQLFKAFKHSDIELEEIGDDAWTEWMVAEDKNLEYDALIEIVIECLVDGPAGKRRLIQILRRILRKLIWGK